MVEINLLTRVVKTSRFKCDVTVGKIMCDVTVGPDLTNLFADVCREGEEEVGPSIDLILLDDLVHHFPGRLPQDDKENNQDQDGDQICRNVLRESAISVLKKVNRKKYQ